jgi:hypothetical protein
MRTHPLSYPVRDVVQSVSYNISALISCNFIITNYVNRKITSYIYLLIFTISLWLHVKHYIELSKRVSCFTWMSVGSITVSCNSFYAYTSFFHFCRQCCRTFPGFSWSLVDVLTMIVLTGNYKKNSSHTRPFR